MAESDKRCVPPCQRLISEDNPHGFCFECLGNEHAAQGSSRENASTAIFCLSKCFTRGSLFFQRRGICRSLRSWGSRADLAEACGMGPPLSFVLSPDHEVLASTSEARLGASSERAEDTSSHASA